MVETPLAFLRLDAIAGAHPRCGRSSSAPRIWSRISTPGTRRERSETLAALSLAVLAARAYGLAVLDGVHLDLDDDAGLAFACEQGRDLGFDGKTLIHPRQIAAANAAFGPSEDELGAARRMVAAWEAARAAGRGVAVVDGRLVEALHVQEALRLVAIAGAIAGNA